MQNADNTESSRGGDRSNGLISVVRPTIIAAVGGTGVAAAKHTIASMRELLGRKDGFDFFAVRAFDTDAQDKKEPRLINTAQFIDLSNFNVRGVINSVNRKPEFGHWKEWLAPLLSAQQASSGVGGVRPKGRLCYSFKRESVREAIEAAVAEIGRGSDAREINDRDGLIVDVSGGINVHIISSVCGGTGSSMFLDLAYDVRTWVRAFTSGEVTVTGHLVLPGAFAGRPVLKSVLMANAYAALQELDRFMRGDANDPWKMQYSLSEKVEIKGPPFDYCYLLDGVGPGGLADIDEITSMIGDAIAQMTVGAVGAKLKSQIRNMTDTKLSRTDQKNRPCCYSSYGLITIEVKNDAVVRQIVVPLVDAVIERLIAPAGSLDGIDDRIKKLTGAFGPDAHDTIRKIDTPKLPAQDGIIGLADIDQAAARSLLNQDAKEYGRAFRIEELAKLEPDINRRAHVARALEADLRDLLPVNGLKYCVSYLARALALAQEILNAVRAEQVSQTSQAVRQDHTGRETAYELIERAVNGIRHGTVLAVLSRKIEDLEATLGDISRQHQEWRAFSISSEHLPEMARPLAAMEKSRGGRILAAQAEHFKDGDDANRLEVVQNVLRQLVPDIGAWRRITIPGIRDRIEDLTAEEWKIRGAHEYDCEDAFLAGSKFGAENHLAVILNSAAPMWEIDEGYALADQRHEISAIGATASSQSFQILTKSEPKLQACDAQRADLIPIFRTEHGISLMGLKRLAIYREPFIRTAIDEQRWDFHLFNDRRWISEMEFPDEPESYLREYELFSKATMLGMLKRDEGSGYTWSDGVLPQEALAQKPESAVRSRRGAFLFLQTLNKFEELRKQIEAKIREDYPVVRESTRKLAGKDSGGDYDSGKLNEAIRDHIGKLKARIARALEAYEGGDRSVPEGILKADVSQIHTEIRAMASLLKERGIGL